MRFFSLLLLLIVLTQPFEVPPPTRIEPIVLRHEDGASASILSDDGSRVLSWSSALHDNTVRIRISERTYSEYAHLERGNMSSGHAPWNESSQPYLR
jgi:hypothetical protein